MMESLEILIPTNKIQQRVTELAHEITCEYHGKSLVVIGVLKGAFIFMGDLIRQLDLPINCDFIRIKSYENNRSTGTIQLEMDILQSITGKDVLLVEDIIDTGLSIKFLLAHLKSKRPKSVRLCSLLYKEGEPDLRHKIDYLGFEIPDVYVVGYGLDAEGKYRALPYLAVLKSLQ